MSVHQYLEKFLLAFIPLFVAIDPIGLVAIFLGLGGRCETQRRQREGTLGLITALCVSIGFIFLGKDHFQGTRNYGRGFPSRGRSDPSGTCRAGAARSQFTQSVRGRSVWNRAPGHAIDRRSSAPHGLAHSYRYARHFIHTARTFC